MLYGAPHSARPLPDRGLGTLIAYSTVAGRWPTQTDLEGALSQLKRLDVVLSITWLLAVTGAWRSVDTSERDREVRSRFLPRWEKLLGQFGRDDFLFSRYTLLWLMRQAFLICPVDGMSVDNETARELLGTACLIANDLSVYREPRQLADSLELAANTLPAFDYYSQEEHSRDIVRTRFILTSVAAKGSYEGLRALPARLERLLGFTIEEYCDLTFAVAMRNMSVNVSDIGTYITPALRGSTFQNTSVTAERAVAFMNSISADELSFRASFEKTQTSPTDLTAFREWPMLRVNEADYAAVDAGLVLDKAGKGLFWTALKRCEDKAQRKLMLGYWGELFEEYVNALLSEVQRADRVTITSPLFDDGQQALDCCVVEHGTIVAIETKSSTLPNSVRYSEDATMLRNSLEKKFVADASERKGVAQLAHFLERFSAGDAIHCSETGQSIHCRDVSKVIPVIVHLDMSLRSFGINDYLAGRLKDLVRSKRPIVTPLALVPVTELEELQGHLDEHLLSELLESHLQKLRTDPTARFFARRIPALLGRKRRIGPMQSRMDQIVEQTMARLFPNFGPKSEPETIVSGRDQQ